jgi:hypothetical protein
MSAPRGFIKVQQKSQTPSGIEVTIAIRDIVRYYVGRDGYTQLYLGSADGVTFIHESPAMIDALISKALGDD